VDDSTGMIGMNDDSIGMTSSNITALIYAFKSSYGIKKRSLKNDILNYFLTLSGGVKVPLPRKVAFV
jgi:hypothetical protein